MEESLILRLGLSLFIGLITGLVRGWQERDAPEGSRTAGFRTYGLVGLLGGISAALSGALNSPAVFIGALVAFAGVFAWFRYREALHDDTFSVTGVVAGLAVFSLGALAVSGDYQAAAAGGVVLAGILASRQVLHDLLRKISWVELRSALLLLGMTVVVLPLLPNRAVDPWGGINPWEIWLFTVLIAAISYVGYIAIRLLGPGTGVLVSALVGAVVSSTAVTVAFARRAQSGDPPRPLAAGASLAAMVSVLRVFVVVLIVKPEVSPSLIAPIAAAAIVFAAFGLVLLRGSWKAPAEGTKLGNPFDLVPLLIFAASFVVVSGISAVVTRYFGSSGVLVTSAISGILDVDVASLTAVRLVGPSLTAATAATAILLAIATNSVARVVAGVALGPRAYWLPLMSATAVAIVAGAAAWWIFG